MGDGSVVTVLAIADQVSPLLYDYFRRERWSNVELVISCGDLPPEYLDFLCSSLNVPLLYVRGNHDTLYSSDRYAGFENLHGKIVECKGIRFAGFEGCRRYNAGPCQYTEAEMRWVLLRSQLRSLRGGRPDIVVTHAPPAGCHDGQDTCHRGFACFHRAIQLWQPAYFIHGHTHAYEPGPSMTVIGDTTVLNAYPYQVFEVPVPAPQQSRPDRKQAPRRLPAGKRVSYPR